MHLLAVALLAHPSGEQLFMLLDRMVRAMGSVPQSQTTMSAMLTMLATSAVFLFDGGCAVAVLFILVCGVALLQSRLIKSSWTLDATRCFRDSTEQLEEHLQDMHERCRTFLFAPYALVRSNSMWKQRGRHQPQHSSPNVWCRLHCETATEHLATLLFDSNSPISQTATDHRPNGAILCEDCDEGYHNVLCPATGHAHIVHATGVGSVLPFG